MDEAATPAAEPAALPSGGRTASELREVADSLRNRVDLFGKTLAAVATLGTTAVGLSKVGDLSPWDGNGWWVVLACAALGLAALAAIWVAVLLMRVARPVFVGVDLENNEDLGSGEREAVRPVFEASARRFGYTSLVGLEARERSLRKAASRALDKDERARRTGLADEVKAEMEQALARGQVVVVRRRATMAVAGPLAWFLYVVVISGLIVFAISTDRVSSDREDPIANAKACGEARKAGATADELSRTKGVCDGRAQTSDAETAPPSPAEARAQVVGKLAAALATCAALVQKEGGSSSGPLTDADCEPVQRAIAEMAG